MKLNLPSFSVGVDQLSAFLKNMFFRRKENQRWLLWTVFFKRVAARLVTFFLPLFLFRLSADEFSFLDGYDPLQKAMVVIASYYLLKYLVAAMASILAGKFVVRFGHRSSLIWGLVIYMFDLLAMFYSQQLPFLIFIAAIFSGLHIVFFWQSYNTLMTANSSLDSMGKELGVTAFVKNLVAMITPAFGGVIAYFLGFNYLFLIGLMAALLSMICVTKLRPDQEGDEVNLREYLDWLKGRSFERLFVSQAGQVFYEMSLTMWPLYVYLLLGDIKTVGIIYSLSLFIAMIINLFVGDFLDRRQGYRLPFIVSGVLLSSFWMMRGAVESIWSVIALDSADKMVGNFHWLFFDRLVFNRSRGEEIFSYFVYRMTNKAVAITIFWMILLPFFLLVPIGWQSLFVLGGVGVLMSLLVQEHHLSEDSV